MDRKSDVAISCHTKYTRGLEAMMARVCSGPLKVFLFFFQVTWETMSWLTCTRLIVLSFSTKTFFLTRVNYISQKTNSNL